MKIKKGLKCLSILACVSMLVSSLPINGSGYEMPTETKFWESQWPLNIVRAPDKETNQTVEEYEKTLYDTQLPSIKGYELGFPVARDIENYGGLEMSLNNVLVADRNIIGNESGYIVDNTGNYAWDKVPLSKAVKIVENDYLNTINLNFNLVNNPSEVAPVLWDKLLKEEQLTTSISSYIRGMTTNILDSNIPTMSFGDLKIEGSFSAINFSNSALTSNATSLNFFAACNLDIDKDGNVKPIKSGYSGENRNFHNFNVVIADNSAPYIKTSKLDGHYLYLTFNEPLRLSDSDTTMSKLPSYKPYVGNIENEKMPAEILGFKDNDTTMVLYLDGKDYFYANEDFKITSFGFEDYYMSKLDTYGYNSSFEVEVITTYDSTSPFSDYAGNTFGELQIKDNLTVIASSPIGDALTISGTMLGEDSTKKIGDNGEWPKDIEKSQLYAGVGETLTFGLEVSTSGGNQAVLPERSDYSQNPDELLYLRLNVKNKDGVYVALPLVSTTNKTRESGSATTGVLMFEPLTFEEGMYIEGDDYIKAMMLSKYKMSDGGSNSVVDCNGVPIKAQDLGAVNYAKQIYVDTKAPEVTEAIYSDASKAGVTIDVTLDESVKGSGMETKDVMISLVGESYVGAEKAPVAISYLQGDEIVNGSISDSPDTFGYFTKKLKESAHETIKLPITFKDTTNVTLRNLKAVVTSTDYAGNVKTTEHLIGTYTFDKNAPTIKNVSSNLSYTNDSTIFNGEFNVFDTDLTNAIASYSWSDGTLNNVAIENGKINISKTFTDIDNVSDTLTITVTDKNGNTSQTFTHEVNFDTSLANHNYKIESDLSEPTLKPIINVSAPNDKTDGTQGFTRATITMGGANYVRIITGDEADVNLFDFSGSWYDIRIDENNQYEIANPISGVDIYKSYNDVKVTLESAFTDLTPVVGNSVTPDVSTGYNKTDLGIVKFAYDDNNSYNKYEIIDKKVNGTEITNTQKVNQTLANYKFDFSILYKGTPNWGLSEVDFNNSFVQLMYKADYNSAETEISKAPLNNSVEQSYITPNKEYETGIYTVKITLQGKNGRVITDTFSSFVVDNQKLANAGIWQYQYNDPSTNMYYFDNPQYNPEIIAKNLPFDFVRVLPRVPNTSTSNIEGHYAVLEDGTKVNVTNENYQSQLGSGAKYRIDKYSNGDLGILIGADDTSSSLSDVGNLEKIEFWGYNGGTKTNVYTNTDGSSMNVGEKTKTAVYVNVVEDILSNINLTPENNIYTIYYQMTLTNSNVSNVKTFNVEIPSIEQLPTAELEYSNLKTVTLDNGEKRVISVDIGVKNPSCDYGNVKIYRAYKEKDIWGYSNFKTEEYTGPIKYTAEDLTANIYADAEEYFNSPVNDYHVLKEFFIIKDEYGGTTNLIPLFDGATDYEFNSGEKDKMLYSFFEGEYLLDESLSISTPVGTSSETIANKLADKNASYVFSIPPTNMNVDGSSITIGEKKFDIFRASAGIKETNFAGAQVVGSGDNEDLFIKFAYPIDKAKADAGENLTFDFTLNAVGKYAGNHDYTNINVNSIPYKADFVDRTEDGVVYFNTYARTNSDIVDYKYIIPTNCDVELTGIEATDLYGVNHTFDAVITDNSKPTVTVSEVNNTINPVTLTFTHNSPITISSTNYGNSTENDCIIKNNGTNEVTVVVKNNMKLTVSSGSEELAYYDVTNINVPQLETEKERVIEPKVVITSYPDGFSASDTVITGAITITLLDSENDEQLYDSEGNPISYIFDPNQDGFSDSYTFDSNSYFNFIGATGEDFTIDVSDDLNITLIVKDTTSPSVRITGKISDGVSQLITKKLVFDVVNTNEEERHPELDAKPVGYIEKTSMDDFIADFGWAKEYIFSYEIADKTETTVFVKNGIIADLPVDYTPTSDIIDGVTLNTINKNISVNTSAEFTLCIEDINKNITFIPFNVTVTEKDFTVTSKARLNYTFDTLYLYIMQPDDVTDFKVTNQGAKIETKDGEFKDCYYLTFTENTNDIEVNYSFKCNGLSFTDSIICSANGLGETEYEVTWSANKNLTKTNKDVVATISFNQNIEAVKFTKNYPTVTAEIKYQQVILTYTGDTPAQTVDATIKLSSGQKTEIRNISLSAVSNIDKSVPTITVNKELAKNGKSVKLIFTSDEMVFDSKGVYSNSFTDTVKSNDAYSYSFTDEAGNIAKEKVDVAEIIDSNLKLQFSIDNSNYLDDPSSLNLDVGDTFYVKSNRDCSITFNENQSVNISKNIGKSIVMELAENESPYIVAEDNYGSCYYQFTGVKAKDTIAPKITVLNYNISAKTSTSLEDLKNMLRDNVAFVDNIDTPNNITLDIDVNAPVSAGSLKVTYKATDLSGNIATLVYYIRIFSEDSAVPTVNGTFIDRNSTITVPQNAQTLIANITNGESFSVAIKSGVKTSAQMKIGATTIVYNQTDNSPIELQLSKQGFYTVCIKTRDRDAYRFIVYVE